MKIKLMIALVVMALVFGMSLTACDSGDSPIIKANTGETIYDASLLGGVDANGKLTNQTFNTTSNTKPAGIPE